MGVHYQCVRPANPSGRTGWRGLDIYFERVPNPPAEDKDVEELRRSFDRAVGKLHLAARTNDQFMPVYNEILDAATGSLVVAGGTVKDGTERLEDIKIKILTLARNRRGRYFGLLLAIGAGVSVIGMLLYLAVYLLPPVFIDKSSPYFADYQSSLVWLLPAFLMLPGAALGVVFIGFATNRLVSYDGIGCMDQYDFAPWQRFTWVVLIAYVLFIALWFDAFVLGVGNVELNRVTTEARFGLLIGLVCGISESLIAELLTVRFRPVSGQSGTGT